MNSSMYWLFLILGGISLTACTPDKPSPSIEVPKGVADFKIGMTSDDFKNKIGKNQEIECPNIRKIYAFDQWSSGCLVKNKDETSIVTKNSIGKLEFTTISTRLDNSIGYSGVFGFVGDKLIAMEISQPAVGVDVLEVKYGKPIHSDEQKKEVCQNRIGGKFESVVGKIYWSWADSTTRANYVRDDVNIGSLTGRCDASLIKFFSYSIYEKEFESGLLKAIESEKKNAIEDKSKSTVY